MTQHYSASEIARVCHEANRALQAVQRDSAPSLGWDEAPPWQREFAAECVEHGRAAVSAEVLHERWCDAKVADGWTFGDVKDDAAKTHPCLVPYDELPQGQRDKDDLFRAVVNALSGPRPPHVAVVAEACASLAAAMTDALPDSAELKAGLRHLAEAEESFRKAATRQTG
jgi:hypothetical protein